MSSGYETIMVEALSRLRSSSPAIADDIRRAHRTAAPREFGRVIHLIDGWDEPAEGKPCGERVMMPTVVIIVRDDAGPGAADELRIAVNDLITAPWNAGITIKPGRIMTDSEIADSDPNRVTMPYEIAYKTAGEYSLLLAS